MVASRCVVEESLVVGAETVTTTGLWEELESTKDTVLVLEESWPEEDLELELMVVIQITGTVKSVDHILSPLNSEIA
jgi:hypothetical protein